MSDLLTTHNILLFLSSVFLVLVLKHLLIRDPLRDIPGPWLNKYSSIPLALKTRTGKRYLYVDQLHKKYGPFVRLTPRQVSCLTPNAPSKIYAHGSSSLPKTSLYRAFYVSGTPSLFSTQDRQGHASKRRALSHPFSYTSVRGLEVFIKVSLEKLVRNLDSLSKSDERGWIDVLAHFNHLTFDVISDLAFGEPLGMLDHSSDILPAAPSKANVGVAAMIDYRGRTAAFLGLFPSILPPSPTSKFVLWLLKEWVPDQFIKRGLQGTDNLEKIAQRCVRKRLSEKGASKRGDLLDRLVDGLGENVSEEDIVTEAMLLLTAGSDTTANSSAAILYHILRNPTVHRKLVEELRSVIPPPPSSTAIVSLPTHDQVKHLPYLNACIDEGLRMFATNAFGLPRVVPDGGSVSFDEQDGGGVKGEVVFDEGTELSSPAYSIQHLPSIWGDDANVFNPDRFLYPPPAESLSSSSSSLTSSPSELKRHLLTFGLGPRACIGKNLALFQIQLLLATILGRYDLQLKGDGWEMESVEGFMHKPVEVLVKLKKREAEETVAVE